MLWDIEIIREDEGYALVEDTTRRDRSRFTVVRMG